MRIPRPLSPALAIVFLAAMPPARSQFAVVDVGAITQLVAETSTLTQQLTTAEQHLAQAQAEYSSMTGSRGADRLLLGMQRNYLPSNWSELRNVLQGLPGNYGSLSNALAPTIQANAILSPEQLATLPPDLQLQIETRRQLAALSQDLSRQSLDATSARFNSLQQLMDALPAANDQKAVLDLQARVSVESLMLQNEQTKLQTLSRVVLAEQAANQQQLQERALAAHGMFGSRFQPVP